MQRITHILHDALELFSIGLFLVFILLASGLATGVI